MVSYANDIAKAIKGAELELNSLNEQIKEYEAIRLRMTQIETFLKAARAVVGVSDPLTETTLSPVSPKLFTSTDGETDITEKTHIESIVEILKEVNKSLSLSELVEEFKKRNWKISEKNGRQVLRASILRRPNIFKKTMQGMTAYYELRQEG